MSRRSDPKNLTLARPPAPRAQARPLRTAVCVIAAASLAAGAFVGVSSTAVAATADAAGKDWSFNPVTALTADTFAAPPAEDLPWVRVNMPPTADPALLRQLLEEAKAANIGGVELGQGAYPNDAQLIEILETANELGIKVSLSHGPTQNPTGYSINDDHARKTLVISRAAVAGGATFTGALPAPAASPNRTTVVAVVAYQCTSACGPTGQAVLDPDSAIDLTSTLTGTNTLGVEGGTTAGSLTWTAPAGGTWQVVTFWSRGAFNQPDPFSTEGHDQLIASMEAAWTPEIAELMRENGGDLFYDSHSSDRGSPDELWTNDMAAEFADRAGYELTPNLAALFPTSFSFADGTAPRVFNDLVEVRTDLWLENHIRPTQEWIRDYGFVMRLQPEGERSATIPIFDQAAVSAELDRPEHESLFAVDEVDSYLPIASANHLTGNPWYSTECCAVSGGANAESLESVQVRMNKSFAGGITKMVYHVYPYGESATSRWPGYHNFGAAGFSNGWGVRQPNWFADGAEVNLDMARNQQVLTQGDAKVDVAVFLQNYLYLQPSVVASGFRMWRDPGLERAGYTRDYLSPRLLDLPNVEVTDGRLAVDGPSYGALVIDSTLEPANFPEKTSMPLDAAERFLAFAQEGLPVIVVGAPPSKTTGNTPEDDAALQAVIAELLALDNVQQVANQAAVPAALEAAGVEPAAKPSEESGLLSVRRVDEATDTDYFFLYNQGMVGAPSGTPAGYQYNFEGAWACVTPGITTGCVDQGEPIDIEVALEGDGYPFVLDAASGEVTPIAEYRVEDGRVIVPLALGIDEDTIIALADDPTRFGAAAPGVFVTSTQADGGAVVNAEGRVVVRADAQGNYKTTLSDGRTVSTPVGKVMPDVDLSAATWQLTVEDWKPANDYATTFGVAAMATDKSTVSVELDALKPWREIAGLENTSGIGTYSTTFTLSKWGKSDGAHLDLGKVFDTYTVKVNGHSVAVDQLDSRVDVTPYLVKGANTLEVRVASTLINRLRSLDTAAAARTAYNYGLLGPVVIDTFGEKEIPVSR
ncbi:glycosyl hydrolase [Microbacterium sp. 2FI]|uniref:glycosyl hydrolase n=1 Tax=Microbacterium sp. 2FI TaxID=2502193 RepID=UPI0010F532C0|nr:glycosyl hydrolase [Microbacterium sp. 2FI]